MVIDCHTHIGSGGLINISADDLVKSMKKAGIDKSLVFAGSINGCPTKRLLAETRKYKGKLYPVGSVSPLSAKKEKPGQVEHWLKNKEIFGLKFYPGYEFFYPDDATLRPYLRLLAKYNRPAIFHSGDTYNKAGGAKLKYAHPLHIDDLAVRLPKLKIIIAHLGYPWTIDAAEVLYKNKNVYADCSGFVYGKFKKEDAECFKNIFSDFLQRAGSAEKILFGTDWPLPDQAEYVRVISKISGRDKENIMHKNAEKVFRI